MISPFFDRLMGGGDFGQREARADGVVELAGFEQPRQFGQRRLPLRGRQFVDEEELQRQAAPQHRREGDRDVGRHVRAVADQLAMRRQHALGQKGAVVDRSMSMMPSTPLPPVSSLTRSAMSSLV